jgi:hypothetical protein
MAKSSNTRSEAIKDQNVATAAISFNAFQLLSAYDEASGSSKRSAILCRLWIAGSEG